MTRPEDEHKASVAKEMKVKKKKKKPVDESENRRKTTTNEETEPIEEKPRPSESEPPRAPEEKDAHPDDPYLLQDATYIMTDPNWKNKQRVLVFSSRGIGSRGRHLMNDMKRLLPHSKHEVKFEKKMGMKDISEICELKSCNNCLFFEARKDNLYMYVAKVPHGPTMKFEVLNMHTLAEIKLSGNCLHGSRPLLTFDTDFDSKEKPHLRLMKEMFIQIFGTPRNHPKSKPFHDHVMSFYHEDGKVYFRHFQISPMTDDDLNEPERQLLTEIGPRFVLDPIRIFDGSFGGRTVYMNEAYATPTAKRVMLKRLRAKEYELRCKKRERREEHIERATMSDSDEE